MQKKVYILIKYILEGKDNIPHFHHVSESERQILIKGDASTPTVVMYQNKDQITNEIKTKREKTIDNINIP